MAPSFAVCIRCSLDQATLPEDFFASGLLVLSFFAGASVFAAGFSLLLEDALVVEAESLLPPDPALDVELYRSLYQPPPFS